MPRWTPASATLACAVDQVVPALATPHTVAEAFNMIFRTIAVAVLLAGGAVVPRAMAQQSGLVYVEPVTADGVRQVQAKLNAMGGSSGPVDGTWGTASDAELRKFQQTNGLQATGQMNKATAAVLGLDPAALTASAAPPPPPQATIAPALLPPVAAAAPAQAFSLGADSMRMIQARLRQLGFYTGEVDASWGPATRSALQSFQSANSLPADGRLTKATVLALGIDPSTMQP
jgi:peptidoglycan hydrolase-like protein with peptidoglycan-binding domain